MNKNIIVSIIIIILLLLTGFLYATRSASDPTKSIETVAKENAVTPQAEGESVYRIESEKSSVQYEINEVLNDKSNLVLGETNQIAGDISISDQKIIVGVLSINAKTFVTDSEKRDGAVARFILKSEDPGNEFITFKPGNISLIPATVVASTSPDFIVSGDLTIAGVTKPAVFAVKGKIIDGILTGTAQTKIKRSDFNLIIPSVKSVASVDDTFTIKADIVANKVSQ